MRNSNKTSWYRRKITASTLAKTNETSTFDIWMQRISSLSQPGLLILALFGYFYTVVPVYEKALLDEEISRKTIELRAMETSLSDKNLKLQQLRVAISSTETQLNQAKTEVFKLKSTVKSQYNELQPRLAADFMILARKLCKLSEIPDGAFSECISSKVLPTYNLSPLSPHDKKRLKLIVDERNSEIHKSWKILVSSIASQKQEALRTQEAINSSCQDKRNTAEYKDSLKRIEIDHACEIQRIDVNSTILKIKLRELSMENGFLQGELYEIVKSFQNS